MKAVKNAETTMHGSTHHTTNPAIESRGVAQHILRYSPCDATRTTMALQRVKEEYEAKCEDNWTRTQCMRFLEHKQKRKQTEGKCVFGIKGISCLYTYENTTLENKFRTLLIIY